MEDVKISVIKKTFLLCFFITLLGVIIGVGYKKGGIYGKRGLT